MNKSFDDIELFNNLAGNETKARQLNAVLPSLYMNLIEEEFEEIMQAYSENNEIEVVDGLADLVVVTIGAMLALGYNPNEIMDEVNRSNLSKFCDNETEAIETVKEYEKDDRYNSVHYIGSNGKFTILGKKDGNDGWKVLKSINYSPADFKQFVENKYQGEVSE